MKKVLDDEDVELRRKAVLRLKGTPPETAIPLLLKAMEDTSWRVRKTATGILTEGYSPEQYAGGLVRLLYLEDNAGARNSAIETLVRLGKKITSFLAEAFDTPDSGVRKFIIDIVGEIRDRKALPLLLSALKDDDENVKASAVEHLGSMGDPSVVDELIGILKGGDLWTAFPAADALGRIGDKKAVPALIDALSFRALREPALKGLGHLSVPETLNHIAPLLMEGSKAIQEEALKTMGTFYHKGVSADIICKALNQCCGQDIIDRIVSLAWSKKADVRANAVLLLGLLKDERALGPLIELYGDEAVSEDVKKALVFIGKSKPEILLPLFETDNQYQLRFIMEAAAIIASPIFFSAFEKLLTVKDGHVRALAAAGLSKILDARAVNPIKRLLTDPYEDVQEAAVAALSSLREGIDVKEFMGYLGDKNPSLRKNAALILGRINAEDSMNALAFALKDEDVSVRHAVIDAFSLMKNEESVRYLIFALTDENPSIRASAALSLGSKGGEAAIDPLIMLLSDTDDSVKVAAIRSLGMIRDAKATAYLIDMLAHRNGFIVTTAMESLGKIGGGEAKDALIGMLKSDDPEIRRTAIKSLVSFAPPFEGFEGAILPFLKDEDWATRVAAVEALRNTMTERVKGEIERLYDYEEDPAVRRAIEECLDA